MQKLLTVVVPVYRVEAYINKCLDSLLVSPGLLEKLEVIIVNDGTPDHSAEMSREYVKRYPEAFRQIDKKNGGHGSAWNVGVREATGRYLRFLDSDDWFTNLDRLLSDLETCEEDVIFHPFNRCYASGNRIVPVGTAVPPGAPVPLSSGRVSFEGSGSLWRAPLMTNPSSVMSTVSPATATTRMTLVWLLYRNATQFVAT